MRLDLYLLGPKFRLSSPLTPEALAKRINDAAVSPLNLYPQIVKGGVSGGCLHLSYQRNLFDYNAKPALAGLVVGTDEGAILDLRFRSPLWFMALLVVWYFGLLTVALTADRQLPPGFWAFLVGPIAFHLICTIRADDDLDELLSFLHEETGATELGPLPILADDTLARPHNQVD